MRTPIAIAPAIAAAAAAATTAAAQPAGPAPPLPPPMRDSAPQRDPDFDWLQFNNGEWLKGEIVEILDDSIVFDSDELGKFTLDLDDIHAVYSRGVTTVMLRDRSLLEGRLEIEGDRVTITPVPAADDAPERPPLPADTPEAEPVQTTRDLSRAQVRSVISGRPTELNFWSGRVGLGGTFRRGNVDQTDLSATFRLQRRTPLTRLSLAYDGAYSLVEGERTENTHNADTYFDVYLTERLFIRPFQLGYFRDEFQNIDYRITPGGGFGYDLIDTSKVTWTAGGGAGWQFERFIQPPPGSDIETDSAAVFGFTTVEWDATDDLDLGLDYNISIPTDDLAAWNARTTVYAEVDIWGDLDLDVRLIWDRNNDPTAGSDGAVPERDDIRLFVGVSLAF